VWRQIYFTPGFLKIFCHVLALSVLWTYGPLPKNCVSLCEIEIGVLKLKLFFLNLEAITLLPTITVEWKAEFQLEVSDNKFVIFFPSRVMDPLKSICGSLGSVDPRLRMAALHPFFTVFNKLTLKVHHRSVLAQFLIHFLIRFPNSGSLLELTVFVHSNPQ
jgi:hypothetical protein